MFFMKFIDFLLKKYQIKKKTQKTLLRFFFAFKMQLKKKGASLVFSKNINKIVILFITLVVN